MKKIILIFSIISIFSCEKEVPPSEDPIIDVAIYPGSQEYGWGKGVKNDNEWECSGMAVIHEDDSSKFGLSFQTVNFEGFERESLVFNDIPTELGKYLIKFTYQEIGNGFVGSSYGMLASHGDVLVGFYDLIESDLENKMEILQIDTSAKKVEGKFTAAFALSLPNGSLPDTVQFEEIAFECDVVE